jgi:rhodanese-related sulfurtransferase
MAWRKSMIRWKLSLLLPVAFACGNQDAVGSIPRVGPDQAQVLLQKPEVLLLDVRTEAEHRERHIPGTEALIPVQDLTSRLKELEAAKSRPILVYCRSGNRSLVASELLKEHGFQDVTDLEGGILAWSAKGLPTDTGAFVPPSK